jgi:hypothetical protein
MAHLDAPSPNRSGPGASWQIALLVGSVDERNRGKAMNLLTP